LTLEEAVRWLKARVQVRCDGAGVKWSLVDVEAVRVVLGEVSR
jgi:hypothetical protein